MHQLGVCTLQNRCIEGWWWLFVYRNMIEERIAVLSAMWLVNLEAKTFAEILNLDRCQLQMERHHTLGAMIQDKSGQQCHACRNSTKSLKTVVRVIRNLCKQTYHNEGLYDWNRNQMVCG